MREYYKQRVQQFVSSPVCGSIATKSPLRVFDGRGPHLASPKIPITLRNYLGERFEHPDTWTSGDAAAVKDLFTIASQPYDDALPLPYDEQIRSILGTLADRKKTLTEYRPERERTQLVGGDLIIRSAPYTRDAGLHLWGFSCDLKKTRDDKFLIYLNSAHQPGAVAATLAHEFGHYLLENFGESRPSFEKQKPLYGISEHLENRQELFCDSVVSLLAFPDDAIQPDGHKTEFLEDDVARALDGILPEYRMPINSERAPFEWRVTYLAATLHLYKLRRALAVARGV